MNPDPSPTPTWLGVGLGYPYPLTLTLTLTLTKAVKTRVKDNTVTVLDSAKLLKEVEALRAQLNTSNMMVRQLQDERDQRDAEEEARLQQALLIVRVRVRVKVS